MTPEERREVIEYGYDHPDVHIVVGYSPRVRAFFATVGDRRGEHTTSPIEAFRRAHGETPKIVSVLRG
jgi:hypothetical protein